MTRWNICNSNNIFTSYRFGRSSRLLPPFLVLSWSFFLRQNTCVAVCFTLLIFFLFVGSSPAGKPRLVTKFQEAAFITFGWFNYLKEEVGWESKQGFHRFSWNMSCLMVARIMKSYLAVFSAVHIPWGISRIPQGIMLLLPGEFWCFFGGGAQNGNCMQLAYSTACGLVLLPFIGLQLKVEVYFVTPYHTIALLLKTLYFWAKLKGFLQVMENLESQRSSFARPG